MHTNILVLVHGHCPESVLAAVRTSDESHKLLGLLLRLLVKLVHSVSPGSADSWLAHCSCSRVSHLIKLKVVSEAGLDGHVRNAEISEHGCQARIDHGQHEGCLVGVRDTGAGVVCRVDQLDVVSTAVRGSLRLDLDRVVVQLRDEATLWDLPSERLSQLVAASWALSETWVAQIDGLR